MGEAARTSGPELTEHKRGPDEIRKDIEQTREELGETVEALAAKTDVKARAMEKVEDAKESATAKVDEAMDRAHAKVEDAKESASAKVDEAMDRAHAKVDAARERALAKVRGKHDGGEPASNGAPAGQAYTGAYGAPAPGQLRETLASPAAYVVIGALAGLLLGVVLARRR